MSLAGDVGAALPELRAEAERTMTLTLVAYSPSGVSSTDDDGYEVPGYVDEGVTPGKVQSGSGKDSETRYVNVGGVERPVIDGGLHIPLDRFVFDGLLIEASEQRGQAWELEVFSIGPADDPALLGRRYMVVSAPAKSFATARRLDVVEIPREA